MQQIRRKLQTIFDCPSVPDGKTLFSLVEKTIGTLNSAEPTVRPLNKENHPGGLLRFSSGLPTLIIPDLHGRADFFLSILDYVPPFGKSSETSVLELLASGSIRVLCLGDGFHSERRGMIRWMNAWNACLHGDIRNRYMEAEMRENLSLMEMVMECINTFPAVFYFLKGNHENVLNEEGHGNHPFGKFVSEGMMVKEYMLQTYGSELLHLYAQFEYALPLCVIAERFMASHAEPYRFYEEEELINTESRPDVIEGLVWTDNGAADETAVPSMLAWYLPQISDTLWFGGHRVVSGRYALRAEGRYVQLHDPESKTVAIVPSDRRFDFEKDIRRV